MKVRIAAVVAALSLVFTSLLLVTSGPTSADAGTGGAFVPLTHVRIADTTQGLNTSASPVTPTSDRDITVLGMGGVPSTGVSAVVLDVSAKATGHTNIYVSAKGTDSHSSFLSVGDTTSWDSNTVIVAPGTAGKVTFATLSTNASIAVDVQGYFTDGSTGTAGTFSPVTPTRVADSTTGSGLAHAKLSSGTNYSVPVGGTNDIPADATAVFANVRVLNSSQAGTLRVGPSAASIVSSVTASLEYMTSVSSDTGLSMKLASNGTVSVNISGGTADLIIDVQGYFAGSAGNTGGGYTPLTNTRIYATSASTPLAPNETREIPIAGQAGVPADGTAGSVAMTVSAGYWTASGTITVANPDDNNTGTDNLAFKAPWGRDGAYSTSIVELSLTGTVSITNNSAGTVDVTLAAQGWFSWDAGPPSASMPAVSIGENPATVTTALSDRLDTPMKARLLVDQDGTTIFDGYTSFVNPAGARHAALASLTLPGLTGGNYAVKARPYDAGGPVGEWTSPREFNVDHPLGNTSVIVSPLLAYSTAATGETAIQPGETRLIQLRGQGSLPDDPTIGEVSTDTLVRNWSSSGSLTFSNPDDGVPTGQTITFASGAGNPTAGKTTSTSLKLSLDGQIAVSNTSSGTLDLDFTTTGYKTLPDNIGTDEGESPEQTGASDDESASIPTQGAGVQAQGAVVQASGVHPFTQRVDNVHWSHSAPGSVHAHGGWKTSDKLLLSGYEAYVTVEIQSAVTGKWKTVEVKHGVTKPGFVSGHRVTARESCSNYNNSWWRARVDVDIIGMVDSSGWTYSSSDSSLYCRP